MIASPLLLGLATGPAQANIASNGAYWDAYVSCNPIDHTFHPYLEVRPRGLNAQWVATRAKTHDLTTGQWSSPTNWNVYLADRSEFVETGGWVYVGRAKFETFHQVQWWDGYRWTADTGWVEDYYRWTTFAGPVVHYDYCAT